MKRIIQYSFLSIIIAISTISKAAEEIDSLRKEILLMPDDTNKVLQLKDLSYKYLKYQLDTALSLSKRSVVLANSLNYNYGYAISLNQLGLAFKYKSEYDSALFYYKKSLSLFDKLKKDRDKASVLNRIGNVYKRFGENDLSIENFMRSLSIYKDLEDSVRISFVLNNIGILYNEQGYYDKSLEYELSSLEIQKKLNLKKYIPITLMNIGNNYMSLKQNSEAIYYYKESLDLLGKNGNKYDKALLVHNLATLYEQTNNFFEAKKYYSKALKFEKEISYNELMVYSLQGMGNTLIKEGKLKEGERYLLQAYNLAEEIGDIRKIHKLSRGIYQVYRDVGKYKESLKFLKRYVDLEDSIYSLERKSQIVELEKKYEAQQREQQIAFLEKEKEIQQLEIQKKEAETKQKAFQRNALFVAIIILFILIIYFYKDNKKKKAVNYILVKQKDEINEQRKEIEKQNLNLKESNSTKDKLFQIIAHDLRSPIVSMESITQLIPYWIEEQDYESLQKLSKTLEVSVNNVLSLIDNLLNWALSQQGKFPFTPENLSLEDNLKQTIDVYLPIARVKKIHLEFRPTKNVNVFADKNMLFTVMRNLLNNAIKFTPEYGKIVIGIDSNQQFAKVWVKDSGVGIPAEKKDMVFELANGNSKGTQGETGKGLGLFFCKEFVNLNNGDIFIDSSPEKGTKITFTLPLFNIAEN